MRKPITYLNIALMLVAVWLAAGTRTEWRQNHARYGAFAAPVPAVTPVGPAAGAPAPAAATPPAEVVEHNLFAQDRNNLQPSLEKKPAPPVPVVIGTMNLASGAIALMADQKMVAEHAFRRVKQGDEIGGYRVTRIDDQKVVVEFEGQKREIDVYESAASVAAAAPAPIPQVAAPATSQVVNAGGSTPPAPSQASAQSRPGTEAIQAPAGGFKPIQAAPDGRTADPYLNCVVEGNRQKCTRQTPFGPQVWYAPLPPK